MTGWDKGTLEGVKGVTDLTPFIGSGAHNGGEGVWLRSTERGERQL